ncbi:MAG: DUF262 domain-containing protein [Thermoleophilia bacterium]|nr:DUF262 domain-containing protein [Thermoleophilia bacterium]
MKPATHTVNELFERDVRYVVPLFQRPYVWDAASQWEPLWNDVCVLLEHLEGGSEDQPLSHFLGAIVLEQELTPPGAIPVFTVIDGQQRLTTLQILLAAASAALAVAGTDDDSHLLSELIRNNPRKATGDDVFKVWPTNANRGAFAAVMSPGGPPVSREDDPDNNIDEAFTFFSERIVDWLADGDVEQRARALRITLVDLLKLVSITLEPGDNAQVIFETLNARGTPLLALDLVKNALFHAMSREGLAAEELYESRWRPELDDDYWRELIVQGRLTRPRGELFLMHWLSMKLRRVIPATELFTMFRRDILDRTPTRDVPDLIVEICRDARIMRSFDTADPASLEGRFFQRLQILDTTTVLPLILLLFREPAVTDGERRRALAIIESWLVRRGLMRLTTRAYNREVPRMLAQVAAHPESAARLLLNYLQGSEGLAARWPSDTEIHGYLSAQRVYGVVAQKRLVMALTAIEQAMQSGKSDAAPGTDLSIEHVMPQKWSTAWPLPADTDEAEAVARRNALVHRLGNLTLVAQPLNAALSNGRWENKKKQLNSHTRLFLNVDILDRYPDAFDESAIEERSTWLADAICRIWPGPGDGCWTDGSDVEHPRVTRLADAPVAHPAAGSKASRSIPVAHVDDGEVSPEIMERIVRAYHEEGIDRGEVLRERFGLERSAHYDALYRGEPLVYPHIRLEATVHDVVAAREGTLPPARLIPGEHPQLRWERIAARAEATVTEVKAVFEAGRGDGAARLSYTGRGRRFEGMTDRVGDVPED